MVTISVLVVVVTVETIVLAVVGLVTRRQWAAASTVSVRVAVVGRRGITGGGGRSVAAAVCTVAATAGLRTIVAYFPETDFRFDYRR